MRAGCARFSAGNVAALRDWWAGVADRIGKVHVKYILVACHDVLASTLAAPEFRPVSSKVGDARTKLLGALQKRPGHVACEFIKCLKSSAVGAEALKASKNHVMAGLEDGSANELLEAATSTLKTSLSPILFRLTLPWAAVVNLLSSILAFSADPKSSNC